MAESKTQGLELYLLDTDSAAVLKVGNFTSLDGVGGSASDIDVTSFDDLTSRRFLVGLLDQGTASFGLNWGAGDASHVKMAGIAGGGQYKWAVGYSDGHGIAPTYDAGPPPDFTLTSGRNWLVFTASLQQWQRNFATDDVVRIAATLRISGDILEYAA